MALDVCWNGIGWAPDGHSTIIRMASTRLLDGYSKHTGRVLDEYSTGVRTVLDGCWKGIRRVLEGYSKGM